MIILIPIVSTLSTLVKIVIHFSIPLRDIMKLKRVIYNNVAQAEKYNHICIKYNIGSGDVQI